MSQFSKKLESYILRSGMSYAEVSKRAGIDRTQLLKMKKGERTGDEKALERLCGTLMLSASQYEEFRRLYLAAKMGDDVYARHAAVKALLEQMGHLSTESQLKSAEVGHWPELPESKAVSGYGTVLDLLRTVIDQENKHNNPSIRLIAQPDVLPLMECLAAAGRSNGRLHLEHVLCFQQGIGKNSDNHYNIETFRHILPLFISGCSYQPFYFYDDVAARFSDTALLPYLLITSDCCVTFSKDLNYALFIRTSDSAVLYQKLYEKLKQCAKPLIKLIPNAIEMIDFYISFFRALNGTADEEYSFLPSPCLAVFLDDTIINRYIRSDLPQADEIAQRYIQMAHDVYSVIRTMPTISYFPEKGLDYFLQKGRIIEIPEEYYTPMDNDTCRYLLSAMLESADKGLYNPFIIDTSRFKMPDNLVISAFREDIVTMIYMHPQLGNLSFTIEEPSLSYAIFDFLRYLRTSNFVYTREQSITMIKKRLEQVP